jgi:hypothetical protein
MQGTNNQNIQKRMKRKKEQASKGHSEIINIGNLSLSMSQDIVQQVADYHHSKEKHTLMSNTKNSEQMFHLSPWII